VQTFTFEGDPDGVVLATLWFEDRGDGRTRLADAVAGRQLSEVARDALAALGG